MFLNLKYVEINTVQGKFKNNIKAELTVAALGRCDVGRIASIVGVEVHAVQHNTCKCIYRFS